MLASAQQLELSSYEGLYDNLIPKDHFLRKFNELVDFSFIYDELEEKYCLDNGRMAESPIILFKYLLLKVLYNMSDADLVERSRYDMSFKYFLGLRPEDDVIHPTTLTKFRKLRLADENLLDMLIKKSIDIAIEKGVVKSNRIIVDATHTKARYNQKSAYTQVLEQAKLLRKTVYKASSPDWKKKFPKKVENGLLEDALQYCRDLTIAVEADDMVASIPAVKEKLDMLREVVDDNAEHLQQSKDADARTGHKTADTSFFGYKTHIAMTDERLVTAAVITSGERADGEQLETLIEKTRATGLEVKAVIGDAAYSSKSNLALAESKEDPNKSFELISKLHPVISSNSHSEGEDGFSFNKDADMFVCPEGHMAIRKVLTGKKDVGGTKVATYFFDIEKCKKCKRCGSCYKEGAKSKSYSFSIRSDIHQRQDDFQKTEHFKELASLRYMVEAKNSEIKRRHGYDVASSSGLAGMEIQGATTLFVANIKRIIKLMDR